MTNQQAVPPENSHNSNNIHSVINTLVQLQELSLAQSEHEAAMSKEYLPQLNESIKSLLGSLPVDISTLFQKIQKRDPVAIAQISNNVCSGCGLSLPVSLVYAVRAAEKIYQCTNCARILYYPDVLLRRMNKKYSGRFEPRRVGIARFSHPTLMIPKLKASERDQAIAELARKMTDEGFADNADKLAEKAIERDVSISTAFEHGLAFPHVRGVEGGGLVMALGISHKGIRWNQSERALSHILFFMIIPTAASVFYQKLFSGLLQTFYKKKERDKLLAAQTPDDLWGVLVKATHNTIK